MINIILYVYFILFFYKSTLQVYWVYYDVFLFQQFKKKINFVNLYLFKFNEIVSNLLQI